MNILNKKSVNNKVNKYKDIIICLVEVYSVSQFASAG